MGLRDMLKKKDRLSQSYSPDAATVGRLAAPEFTFIRSDTNTEEVIYPPASPLTPKSDDDGYLTAKDSSGSKPRRSLDVFKSSRSRGNSASSARSEENKDAGGSKDGPGRRKSHRLPFGSRSPSTSEFVPENLPSIRLPGDDGASDDRDNAELEWENRATILVKHNTHALTRSATPSPAREKGNPWDQPQGHGHEPKLSGKEVDDMLQEAIRLHEDGELEKATVLFGKLADPRGANNPLSQVLYGLALRHGWGCEPSPEQAITYLSAAASNAALVEDMALKAGMKKGGAAKGELVLAIFELANCFRHGWGAPKDAVAAKQYYETAANLGDTDAMNEVAWCYLEGFGCKKDKFASARYYRLAEKNGNKTLGNTWIWKDKYDPNDGDKKKKKK